MKNVVSLPIAQAQPQTRRKADNASLATLEVVTLSLLTVADRTGYDIRKWLDQYGTYVGYTAQTSQIYRQLGKTVERGWATLRPDPRSTGPDAKLYSITDAGRDVLAAWVDSPYVPARRPLDPDFQLRLRFGAPTPHKALELVRTELAFRREQESVRREQESVRVDFEEHVPRDATAEQRRWAEEWLRMQSERGHYMVRALLAWLEAAEIRLEAIIRQP
jgi:DNA-binding PadR family transcriptional regulator